MFDPRPLCCSSLTTAVGGTTDTNFVDSAHPTVARISWDESNPREMEKMRPLANPRSEIYALSEDMEMKARISTLARKVEELEGKRLHEVQTVTENPAQANPCTNFQSPAYPTE